MTKATSEPLDRRRRDRRHRVPGPQQAVDHPGLAADLGRHPAGDHGDETGRAHRQRETVQPAPVVEPRRAAARAGSKRPSANIRKPRPTMIRNDQKTISDRRPIVARDGVEAGQRRVRIVLEDQRAELRDLDRSMDRLRRRVGQAEQDQRRAVRMAFEMALHRHDLGRLVLERVEAVQVADEDLHRRDQGQPSTSPSRTWCGPPACRGPCSRCHAAHPADHQRGGQIGGDHGVDEPVGEARVEDDVEPAPRRHELALPRSAPSRSASASSCSPTGSRRRRARCRPRPCRSRGSGAPCPPAPCRTASRRGSRPRGRRRSAPHRP